MNFRRNCLILACTFFALTLVIAAHCRAETRLDVGAAFTGSSLGYTPGIGLVADAAWRSGDYELSAYGKVSNQHKLPHDFGYTHAYGARARVFLWGGYNIAVGLGEYGYRSETDDGSQVWRKQTVSEHYQAGYRADRWGLELTYYPQENDTPNHVEALAIKASREIYDNVVVFSEHTLVHFDQGGEHLKDGSLTFGMLYRFDNSLP